MGAVLYYGYYPKEIAKTEYFPFLNQYPDGNEMNGKHLKKEFIEILNKDGQFNEEGDCWIFTDINKIMELAKYADERMCDYVCNPNDYYYSNKDVVDINNSVFIIWHR